MDDAQWEFFVNLKFATSGANYADVYLMSNASDLTAGVSGYFVRIGGTADRVELFRSDAGTATTLAVQSPDGVVNSSTNNPFKIKVTRSAASVWTMSFDDGVLGTYTPAGSIGDATYTSATHFGVRIEQSTAVSAINNHFFDDCIVGAIAVDLTPPSIVSATVLNATSVDVHFSEALDAITANTAANHVIDQSIGAASTAVLDGVDPALVHLTFTNALQNGITYTLTSNGVKDLAGNACVNATTTFSWLLFHCAFPSLY